MVKVMERNMDESRKAFESWFKNYTGCPHDQPGIEHISDLYFMVWAASRAAIEIELPLGATKDDKRLECETSYEGSFNLCLYHVTNAIRSAGIKVKE